LKCLSVITEVLYVLIYAELCERTFEVTDCGSRNESLEAARMKCFCSAVNSSARVLALMLYVCGIKTSRMPCSQYVQILVVLRGSEYPNLTSLPKYPPQTAKYFISVHLNEYELIRVRKVNPSGVKRR